LVEGRVDVVFGGVQIADAHASRLSHRQFTTVHDRIVARADHPIFANVSDGKLKDPMQVLNYPWIVYSADPVYELETVHGMIERLGRPPDIRIRSESMVATFGFLQQGNYLCVLPEASVSAISNPRIVSIPVELGHRMVQSGALFRKEMEDWPPLVRLLDISETFFNRLKAGLDQ
jgi:DNA-binding transcriptional LysR family regulator